MASPTNILFQNILRQEPYLYPPNDVPLIYQQKVAVTPEEAISLCDETRGQSACSKWFQERRCRITASRAHQLYNYDGEFLVIRANEYFNQKPFAGNATTAYGLEMEPRAQKWYASQLPDDEKLHTFGLVVSPNMPWLAVSPDGVVFKNGVPERFLEIKSPVAGQYRNILECSIPYLTDDKKDLNHKHGYYCQIQMGMYILNLSSCDFLVYSPFAESLLLRIERNDRFINSVLCTLYSFYFNFIVNLIKEDE
jgi:hypothetical protein